MLGTPERFQALIIVTKNGRLNRVDAEIFLCALYRRENQAKLAVPLVQDLIQRYPHSPEALQARERLRKLGVASTGRG